MQPYHYKESGLDNVYLYNISIVHDVDNEQVFYIPHINQLHNVIAQAIINKKGLLKGNEIRFIRTHACLLQSQLAEKIGRDTQSIGRWERGEISIDRSMDMLIRLAVSEELGFDLDISQAAQLNAMKAANDNIDIDGTDNCYKLMTA